MGWGISLPEMTSQIVDGAGQTILCAAHGGIIIVLVIKIVLLAVHRITAIEEAPRIVAAPQTIIVVGLDDGIGALLPGIAVACPLPVLSPLLASLPFAPHHRAY